MTEYNNGLIATATDEEIAAQANNSVVDNSNQPLPEEHRGKYEVRLEDEDENNTDLELNMPRKLSNEESLAFGDFDGVFFNTGVNSIEMMDTINWKQLHTATSPEEFEFLAKDPNNYYRRVVVEPNKENERRLDFKTFKNNERDPLTFFTLTPNQIQRLFYFLEEYLVSVEFMEEDLLLALKYWRDNGSPNPYKKPENGTSNNKDNEK